ncbi:MAG TPA: single-stranded DNA-binding protein [Pseudonocardiaceae bacterium]|jgi:single-strand DNA-binding protein|nr:single-stranded DNA-binding protein [Pseudonocardiaceae bacterium]
MDNFVMGNVCQDPVLRQPARGAQPVARFTVAVNRFRRDGVQWIQRDSVFHRVVCFGPLAENVTNSLRKGMEVVAVGEWADDSYTDEQGQRRVQIVMEARSVGPSLRWATAAVHRNPPRDGNDQLTRVDSATTGVGPNPIVPNHIGPNPIVPKGSDGTSLTDLATNAPTDNDDSPPPHPASTAATPPTKPDPSATVTMADPPGRRRTGAPRRKAAAPEPEVARAG